MTTNFYDIKSPYNRDISTQPVQTDNVTPDNVGFSKMGLDQQMRMQADDINKSVFPETSTEKKIKDIANQNLTEQTTDNTKSVQNTMSKDEFYGIVHNAINSGDFKDKSDEEVYNTILKSIQSDGVKIEGVEVNKPVQEDLQGLDIGVKTGQAISNFGDKHKFQSNADDSTLVSGLKFLGNLPSDTIQLAGDLVSIASNPVGTVQGVGTLGQTLVEKGLNNIFATNIGQKIGKSIGFSDAKLNAIKGKGFFTSQEKQVLSEALNKETDRIMNEPGRIKELAVENPADVLLTITGGLGIAKNIAKAKNMTNLANKIEQVEKITNPIKIQTESAKLLGKGIAKGATKAQTKLIDTTLKFTPTQTKKVRIATGNKSPSEWLLDKGIIDDTKAIKGGDGIVAKLQQYNTDTYNKLNEAVKSAKGTFKNTDIDKALTALGKELEDVPGLENKTARVNELLVKSKKGLTLDEQLEVKRLVDSTLDLYKANLTPKAGVIKEGLQNIRRGVRQAIEKEAEKQGLGDVKALSNDIQISRLIKDNLIDRIDTASPNRILSLTDLMIGGGAGMATGDMGITLSILAGKKILESSAFKLFATKTLRLPTTIINKIGKGLEFTKKEALAVGNAIAEYVKVKGADIVDDLADKVGARSKFMQDTGKSLDDFGTPNSKSIEQDKKYKIFVNQLKKAQEASDKAKNISDYHIGELDRQLENIYDSGWRGPQADKEINFLEKEISKIERNYLTKQKQVENAIKNSYKLGKKAIMSLDEDGMVVVYFETPKGQVSFHMPIYGTENINYYNTINEVKKYIPDNIKDKINFIDNYKWSGKTDSREIIEEMYKQANK